ncbi:MAG: hypothetical protein K8T25_08390 [Planctomycetia bacterium]|nr:hypothetical protein [Planctomycetia bacterium]
MGYRDMLYPFVSRRPIPTIHPTIQVLSKTRFLACIPIVLAAFILGCERSQPIPTQSPVTTTKSQLPNSPAIDPLDEAIAAHGGKDVFANLRAGRIKLFTRGFLQGGAEDRITTVELFEMPDRLRRETAHVVTKPGEKDYIDNTVEIFVAGNAWKSRDGKPFVPFDKDDQLGHPEIGRVQSLYPFELLNNLCAVHNVSKHDPSRRYEVSGRSNIGGRTVDNLDLKVNGVRVVNIAIDSMDHLVRESTKAARNPFTGQASVQKIAFSDYKPYGSLNVPTVSITTLDGKPFIEKRLLTFELLDAVDPSAFDPKQPPQAK